MKQHLQLKVGQHLKLTPQLQQTIRFLQLSSVELQQEIQHALDNNPLLEVVTNDAHSNINEHEEQNRHKKEHGQERSHSSEEPVHFKNQDNAHSDEFPQYIWDEPISRSTSQVSSIDIALEKNSHAESLQEQLLWQVNLTHLSMRDRLIAEFIIDATQPNGRLESSPEQLFKSMSDSSLVNTQAFVDDPIEFDEFEAVRHLLQHFTPVGCCSYTLGECLLAQIHPQTVEPLVYNAIKQLLNEHTALLADHDYKRVARMTHINIPLLKKALEIIRSLDPLPGKQFDNTRTDYIVPDIEVVKRNHEWQLKLNDEYIPNVTINQGYIDLLKSGNNQQNKSYLQAHLPDAKNLLHNLRNRNQTLIKVCSAILEIQKDFFEKGPSGIKPLTQQQLAQQLDVHESTISRITSKKYMLTPLGVYELKYFFSSQIQSTNSAQSSTAVQSLIQRLVLEEDKKKPLSDTKICHLLSESNGISIARRTVAKYRDVLGIPSSSERKKIHF